MFIYGASYAVAMAVCCRMGFNHYINRQGYVGTIPVRKNESHTPAVGGFREPVANTIKKLIKGASEKGLIYLDDLVKHGKTITGWQGEL